MKDIERYIKKSEQMELPLKNEENKEKGQKIDDVSIKGVP